MYRARSVVNNLVPFLPTAVGHQRFASWLIGSGSKATSLIEYRKYSSSVATEPFLNGSSSVYVEEMYNSWLADPKSVHASWDAFFRNSTSGALPGQAYTSPPSLAEPQRNHLPISSLAPYLGAQMPALGTQVNEKVIDDHLAVQAIIRSYQN